MKMREKKKNNNNNKKEQTGNQKTASNIVDLKPTIPTIILNINDQNIPIQSYRLAEWM